MSTIWKIPCINIESLLHDFNSEEAIGVSRKFSNAAQEFGFVTITNHGIPVNLMQNLINSMNIFMTKSLDYRKNFCVNDDDHGYFPAARDGKEGFDIRIRGIQWPDENGCLEGVYDTRLPDDDIPDFKENAGNYIQQMSKLAKILLAAIGRTENFGNAFDKIMPGHRSFLRLNYYPKRETAFATGSDDALLNCVEHFDSGLITLLYQDNIGGLEVQRPSDMQWIAVPPVEGSLVINTGRAMERITNGKSKATKHRVRFTKNALRHSIPYFVQPNAEAEIWPFGVSEKERKFEPVKYLEWYNKNIRRNFPEYSFRKKDDK